MELAHLLNQMCHEVLTITDLNAIREARGFSGAQPDRRVDRLTWNAREQQHGKPLKIKGYSANHKVKAFRVVLFPQRTD